MATVSKMIGETKLKVATDADGSLESLSNPAQQL